ncbi:MAG: cytochrome c biogenesis protein ResB [Desulfobacterales bacterium]|nr:cytochrome c biogenesis protein ResB [Desulfobacterales bacterium]
MKKNAVWRFFASVKLALFTFFVLAATSIIGTVIPQNSSSAEYLRYYGQSAGKLILLLDINDMYNSWWFVSLLILFSVNLIVCSIERLPNVWRMVVMDNLATDPARLRKMGARKLFVTPLTREAAVERLQVVLGKAGWRPRQRDLDGNNSLLFSQKSPWVRFGVYLVHLSVLIIFTGAIIGSFMGYKASVYIPEGGAVDYVYETGTGEPIPLGFTVRCDKFDIEYYDVRPKEYRSDLTILENGREVLKKRIIVNDPLDYKGLTFYQSSYDLQYDYIVSIKDQTTGQEKTFQLPPRRQVGWPGTDIQFGIVSDHPPNNKWGSFSLKIWYSDNKGPARTFVVDNSAPVRIERPDTSMLITAKGYERYSRTGLQVAKDPGVWYVYTGCTLMLLGLLVTFFLAHRRIWVHVSRHGEKTEVLVAGHSNKNKVGFENAFDSLVDQLQDDEQLQLSGKTS